eukprot:gene2954-3396_t
MAGGEIPIELEDATPSGFIFLTPQPGKWWVVYTTMDMDYSSDFIIRLDEGDDIQYKTRGPKLVRNYYLGDVLGEGAYGKVKDGMDTFTQKRVAVKILKRDRLKKIPGGEASVLKEINITKKLHNKHIIKLIDHFTIEEKGKLYIVYEHIGGGTLQYLIESSPTNKLPLCQAQNIFNQLLEAIQYIHTQKILHRDIKPDNILFTNDGLLKLTDFGVSEDSSLLDDFECLSRSYGSPAFQPPELTSFQRSFSPFKIDIWAMGVTLYVMTVGKFPFSGANMYMLFENISKCNIDFPANLDKDLCSLIRGILQIDQNQRFTLDQIKNHVWCNKTLASEAFIPLPKETKFDPVAMAYGEEDEDLIFGYENDHYPNNFIHHQHDDDTQQIPTLPPPTINLHLVNGSGSLTDSSELMSSPRIPDDDDDDDVEEHDQIASELADHNHQNKVQWITSTSASKL